MLKNNDYGDVRLVINRAIWAELCRMAGVKPSRMVIGETADTKRNYQAIDATTGQAIGTFYVCATMLLGNADAMMLAQIARYSHDSISHTWFDGLELI